MTQHIMFKAGDVLFHQGDASDRVLHVNSGEVTSRARWARTPLSSVMYMEASGSAKWA